MRRHFAVSLLLFAFALSASAADAKGITEATFSLQKADEETLINIQTALASIKAFKTIEWEPTLGRFRVRFDPNLACAEDILHAINLRSHDGAPLARFYEDKDPRVTVRNIRAVMAGMEAKFGKDRKPKELLPEIAIMGANVQRLAEALLKPLPPDIKDMDVAAVKKLNHELAVLIYKLNMVAPKDLPDSMDGGIQSARKAVDALTGKVDPSQLAPAPKAQEPVQ